MMNILHYGNGEFYKVCLKVQIGILHIISL